MHGGTVTAQSAGEGLGSEFVVRLPVVTMTKAEAAQAVGRGEQAVSPAALRVLVVDDNEDAADSLAQLLEVLGNDVRTANDGDAGVATAREFRPAVVLKDLGMPKLNGYEACRQIREQPWGQGMTRVALRVAFRLRQDTKSRRYLLRPIRLAASE